MSRKRVLDLAKELGLETKVTIKKLSEIGINVKTHFNAISDYDAEKLRSFVKTGKNPEKEDDSSQKRVLIRRRKPAEAKTTAASAEEKAEKATPAKEPQEEATKPAAEPVSTPEKDVKTEEAVAKTAPQQDAETQKAADTSVEASAQISEEPPKKAEAEKKPAAKTAPEAEAPEDSDSDAKLVEKAKIIEQPTQTKSTETAKVVSPAKASTGAKIIKSADPAPKKSGGATILRREDPTPASKSGSGATIIRRSEGGSGGGAVVIRSAGAEPRSGGRGGPRPGRGAPAARGGETDRQPGRFGSAPGRGGDRPGAPGRGGPGGPGGRFGDRDNRPGGRSADRPMAARGGAPSLPPIEPAPEETKIKTVPRDKSKDQLRRKRMLESDDIRPGKVGAKAKKDRFYESVEAEEVEAYTSVRTVYTPSSGDTRRRAGPHVRPRRRKGAKSSANTAPMKASKKVVKIEGATTVGNLAQQMSLKAAELVKKLVEMGVMATVNETIDYDTAVLLAAEFQYEVQNVGVEESDILVEGQTDEENLKQLTRPPVVTIMGHVDHGKTSLLDAIRSSRVADREAGGITQHIGAYQVKKNGKPVTFVDTPGHEAFTSMRARGAQVTDIVILVVAADDGVMPQTIEAIAHAKAAKVPIIVAVNKMDKPSSNPEKVMTELSQHNVLSEEWGGDAMFIKCSAKSGEGLEELLEGVLLQAEVLELKAPKDGQVKGIVVESRLDKARGAVASIIVTSGTLKPKDWVIAGSSYGRIRAMFDDKGKPVKTAGPSYPVEILGLASVPGAGDVLLSVASDEQAKRVAEMRTEHEKKKALNHNQKAKMEALMERLQNGEEIEESVELPLIIKADTQGSVEALLGTLKKLDTEKVKTRVIHQAVGGVSGTDVSLAQASGAIIFGFNVRPDKQAREEAEEKNVEMQFYSIIYELADSVKRAMVGQLEPISQEKYLGQAEVRDTFSVPKIGVIAGCAVTNGKVMRNAEVRLVRDGVVIYTGKISSLKRFKDDAKEVVQGFECGIGIQNYNDLKPNDVIECFTMEEVAATLD